MKRIGVLSLLLIPLCLTHAQSFDGGYILKQRNPQTTEGYYFQENNEFTWFKFSDNNKQYGRGTYTRINTSITLNFGKAPRHLDIQVAETDLNGTQTCNIEVRALHSNGPPLSGLKVILEKSNISEVTDTRGRASIEIRQPLDNDKVIFELDGNRTEWKTFPLKGIDMLFALVVDDAIKYREDQKLTTNFKKSGRSIQIGIQPSFKKVRQRRFTNIYER